MLEKLSGDAVEPDQLAQLRDTGLSQPLQPAQGPEGAEVEWWKLGSMVLGCACSIECAPRAFQFAHFDGKHGIFDVFGRMTTSELRTHQLPLTQSPSKFDERFYHPKIDKVQLRFSVII